MKKLFLLLMLMSGSVVCSKNIHEDKILILDFGSQYTQLIARRVREAGVYCEIHPYDMPQQDLKSFAPKGIILSGGPETVTLQETPRAPEIIFEMDTPILGICYGMHTMVEQLGGTVAHTNKKEFGHAEILLDTPSLILMQETQNVWMSHGDHVEKLPQSFIPVAHSTNNIIAAMMHTTKPWFGVQFHPEVTHTHNGALLFKNFIRICECTSQWTPSNIIEESIAHIKQQVGDDQVLVGVSGGVDSCVVAALMHEAIGDQLRCVFVDNGLLRKNEVEEVHTIFTRLGISLITVDAQDRFLNALQGVSDPERKRKIIGHEFIAVFEQEAKKLNNIEWLAQGTIYPDVVESAKTKSGKAHTIKSHHNVGGLPEKMNLKLIEPLRELFKDEVRKVGTELGLPDAIVNRHPLPGPGLAFRILGEVKKEFLHTLAHADAIYIEELRKNNLYDQVSQAFAVFLPVKSVGVKGDARHYEYVLALRAVETVDFMTARWAHLPYDFLAHVSNRIINEVEGISRVAYDISSKPPATIEWE